MNQRLLALCAALALCALLPPAASLPVAQAQETPPAEPTPPPALPPGGFIVAEGSQLTRLGQPVVIKGINYYPQRRPWAEMWSAWDATQTQREWRLAREQLGINTVRVLLPYSTSGKNGDEGRVDERLLRQLRELAQIAGDLDLRLIVTLFDFYNDFPQPGTRDEEKNFVYLRTLIGNFVGDERIFAWDIHNEPDNYPFWKEGNAPQALLWLGRMADEIHRIAPNQLVTVGMGQYDYLWQAGPDGRRVIDYTDLVSVHIYNPPDAVRQLDELRSYTQKPIIVEEFGWPSGPPCAVSSYTEAQQQETYRMILAAAQGRTAGVVAWTLRDYDAGPTTRWDTREEYYGLFRADDSLKPAAEELRVLAAPPLPSVTKSSLPLSSDNPGRPGGEGGPVLVGDHYVKAQFRRAWELLGGQGSFGRPLSEAFERAGDGRIVQYFEAATLELHSEAKDEPGFGALDEAEQIRRQLWPVDLGRAYSTGKQFPPPQPVPGGKKFDETGYAVGEPFLSFWEGIGGRWRLGVPISGELTEDLGGVPTRVQYFEKGMLLWNEAAGLVEVGRLGSWAWGVQCAYTP